MFKTFIYSAVIALSLMFVPPCLAQNKVDGLELPVDQTVTQEDGFIQIDAKTDSTTVSWLVLSLQKVKYSEIGPKSLIVAVPKPLADADAIVSIYAVAVGKDGKLTKFAVTNITVKPVASQRPPAQTAVPLNVIYIIDREDVSVGNAAVLNSQALREALRKRGHTPVVIDIKEDRIDKKKLRSFISDGGGPPLIILMDGAGEVKAVTKLPSSEAEVLELVDKHSAVHKAG